MLLSPELRQALARVTPAMADSATLPPACYTDPAVHEADCAMLRASWIGIGRADRWSKPGDYTAMTLAGVPVIVVRAKDGSLKAHANTCRHRGLQLAEGEGNVPRFTCPFHGWTYGLDGELRGTTRMGHACDFQTGAYGLIGFRTNERGGFAFVCMDEKVADIDAWLGNFDEHHAPWPLETLVTSHHRTFEVACNWKLFLEVFNEWYHLRYVHGATFGNIYQEPDAPDAATGATFSQFGITQGTGGLKESEQEAALPAMPGLAGRNRQGVRYTWVFPTITFATGVDAMWAYDAQPIAPDRCRVTMWVAFPPETIAAPGFAEKAQRYYVRMDEALDEDIAMLERQQRGMTSPYARQGRWSELEPGAASFAAWYAERLTAA